MVLKHDLAKAKSKGKSKKKAVGAKKGTPTDQAKSKGKKPVGAKKGTPTGQKAKSGGPVPKKNERKGVNPEDPGVVFVNNLPETVTESSLIGAFKDFAKVEKVALLKRNNVCTGGGFVQFKTEAEMQRVLDREEQARSAYGFKKTDKAGVSYSGAGFSVEGRLLRVVKAMKKDDLKDELVQRLTQTTNPRRLDLVKVGEISLDDPVMKKYNREFINKYRRNLESKRRRLQDVNFHVSDHRVRIGNAPSGLDKGYVKDQLVEMLMNSEEGKDALLRSMRSIMTKGKKMDDPNEPLPANRKGLPGARLLAHKCVRNLLIHHETKTDKEQEHDAAQRHKYTKGRASGSIFIDFYGHSVARFVIEHAAFRQDLFKGSSRPLIAEFAIEDKRKEAIHDAKKNSRDRVSRRPRQHLL